MKTIKFIVFSKTINLFADCLVSLTSNWVAWSNAIAGFKTNGTPSMSEWAPNVPVYLFGEYAENSWDQINEFALLK